MTRVYVARLFCECGKDLRISRKVYTEAARRLLKEALQREYAIDMADCVERKSENGKPYLEGVPFCFNLSHSGEYVACALSDSDVGVDIEEIKPISEGVMLRFVGRFEESDCENTRLWTRYEALGKFLGKGIPYKEPASAYFLKDYFEPEGYALTVCAGKDDFADKIVILHI